jgi:hypothetical protein
MQRDQLAILIKTIEKECTGHNIQIFYGSIQENMESSILTVEDTKGDWLGYLHAIIAMKAKVIVLSVQKNDMGDFDEIQEAINQMNEELKPIYVEAFSLVGKTKNQIGSITVNFFDGYLNFQFCKKSEWFDDYQFLLTALDPDDDDEEERKVITSLTEDEIEKTARLIVAKPAFLQSRNVNERRRICWYFKEFEAVQRNDDRLAIQEHAEKIFQDEIYPKQEEELWQKVQGLKKKGQKKGQIKAKLNITENTLNRHYYND